MFIIYSCIMYIYIYVRTMGSQYSCLITEPILWAGPGMKHQTTSWGGFSTSWAQAHWPAWVIPNHPLWFFFPYKTPQKKNPTKNHVPLVFGQFSLNFPKFFYVINWSLDKKCWRSQKKSNKNELPDAPKASHGCSSLLRTFRRFRRHSCAFHDG